MQSRTLYQSGPNVEQARHATSLHDVSPHGGERDVNTLSRPLALDDLRRIRVRAKGVCPGWDNVSLNA
jgi:hypothetical protein